MIENLLASPRPRVRYCSRMALRDLAAEILAGLTQRPGRSVLTMLGTALGVGAFVAVLGLADTAGGQIGKQFSLLEATTVTVTDVAAQQGAQPSSGNPPVDFPPNSDARIQALNGVERGGVWWTVPLPNPVIGASAAVTAGSDGNASSLPVYAATTGALEAMQPTVRTGEIFSTFDISHNERVAILGPVAAQELGISQLTAQPAIFINNIAFTVIGILTNVQRVPDMLLGIVVPATTAKQLFGSPQANAPAQMVIRTRIGAAQEIAREAPLALRPDDPGVLQASAPFVPHGLRNSVNSALAELFLALAGVSLVIGAVGIANTTLVAVLERAGEIGLRRALGARPRHIAAQFLAESTALGLLGGLIGTSLAVAVVIAVAVTKQWTAILDPVTVLPAPLLGAVTGLLAGLYPAIRASRVEPLEALRR